MLSGFVSFFILKLVSPICQGPVVRKRVKLNPELDENRNLISLSGKMLFGLYRLLLKHSKQNQLHEPKMSAQSN